jgi:hypothetical protein
MRSRLTIVTLTAFLLPSAAFAQNAVQSREAPDSQKDQPFDPHSLSGIWWGHAVRGTRNSLSATPPPMTHGRSSGTMPQNRGWVPRGKPLGNDPMMICDPMGFPRILFWNNYPYEIIQLPNRVIMFFDWFYTYRTIWTDGRQLPADPDPRWYGYSVGKWDGDILSWCSPMGSTIDPGWTPTVIPTAKTCAWKNAIAAPTTTPSSSA